MQLDGAFIYITVYDATNVQRMPASRFYDIGDGMRWVLLEQIVGSTRNVNRQRDDL